MNNAGDAIAFIVHSYVPSPDDTCYLWKANGERVRVTNPVSASLDLHVMALNGAGVMAGSVVGGSGDSPPAIFPLDP